MTREQIIEEIWKLSTYDLIRVSMMDDWILFVRLWPVWVFLLSIGVVGLLYDPSYTSRYFLLKRSNSNEV